MKLRSESFQVVARSLAGLVLSFALVAAQSAYAGVKKREVYAATESDSIQTSSAAPAAIIETAESSDDVELSDTVELPVETAKAPVSESKLQKRIAEKKKLKSPSTPDSAKDSDFESRLADLTREVESLRSQIKPKKEKAEVIIKTSEEKGAYTPVPSDQRDSIANRLKLVEQLLRRHGRAYDYRIHTTQDLSQLLTKLDQAIQGVRIQKPTTSDEI
jgi:hypothetical protein